MGSRLHVRAPYLVGDRPLPTNARGHGRHTLYRWLGNPWQTLLSPQPSPALRIGEQPKHLLLVRESGLTRLFANGQEVSLITDIAAPAGRSGVYASTNAGGLEARFDNDPLYDLP